MVGENVTGTRPSRRLTIMLFACVLIAEPAFAGGQAADAQADAEHPSQAVALPFKATAGYYWLTGGDIGLDVNLRYSSGLGNLWGGYFASRDRHTWQSRVGWDRVFTAGPVRVLPTVQYASGGFVGGGVAAEVGLPWFVGAGIGRTNLKPYVNLNFDPNDAYLLSAGRRGDDGTVALIQYIRDNRQNPDQRHLHFIYRAPFADSRRLTLDVLYKRGLVEGEEIRKLGATVGYDWPRFFVRVAFDPKVNFTPDDMWRVSLGLRF
jgi:hypothetical protein